jgi:hypothetical protein
MATITKTGSDARLKLGAEEFVRKLGSFGNKWERIRVGMRLVFDYYGAQTYPAFCIGICRGSTNTFRSASTTDYVGHEIGYATVPSTNPLQYNFGYSYMSSSSLFLSRVGSTNTLVTGTGGTCYFANTYYANCSTLYLDFIKSSDNRVSIKGTSFADSAANSWTNRGDYLNRLEQETSVYPMIDYSYGTVTAVDSTQLDTLSIYWSLTNPYLYLLDLNVIRIS